MKIMVNKAVYKTLRGRSGLALMASKKQPTVRRWQRTTKRPSDPTKRNARDVIDQARSLFDSLNNTVRLSMKRGHGWGDTSVEKKQTELRKIASQLEAEHNIKLDWMATGTPNAVFKVEKLNASRVAEQATLYQAPKPQETKVTNVPVSMIERNEKQPRKHFDPEALEELARSIETHGLQQPIVVRPHPGERGKFQVVAGERRWRAHQLAKMDTIPCIIRHLSDRQMAEVALLENITREDLTPIEEGNAYRQMLDMDWTLEELSKTTGKSTSYIRSMMTLSNLVPEGQKLVENGDLKVTMALRIASIPDHDLQRVALRRASKGDMSTEEFTLYVEALKTEQALLPLFGGELEEAKQLPRGVTRKRAKSISRTYNGLINDVARLVRRAINAKDFSVYPRVLQGELGKKIEQLELIEKGVRRIRQELVREQQRRGIIRRAEAAERMKRLRETGKLGKGVKEDMSFDEKVARLKALLEELLHAARQCGEGRAKEMEKTIKGRPGLLLLPSKKRAMVRRWQRVAEKAKTEYKAGKQGRLRRDVPFLGWKKGDRVEILEVDSKHRAVRVAKLKGEDRTTTSLLAQEDVKLSPQKLKVPTKLGLKGKVQNVFLKLKKTGSVLVSGTTIGHPEEVARMFRFLKDSDREKFYVVNLTGKGEILNVHLVSLGTLNAGLVHPREVFKSALLSGAKQVYLVHNHPSGEATPSDEDLALTKRLWLVGKGDLDIEVAGHVVVGGNHFSCIDPETDLTEPSSPIGPKERLTHRVQVVEIRQKRREARRYRLSGETVKSPADVARLAQKVLDPTSAMIGAIYLSSRNTIQGIEILGSDIHHDRVVRSSILHNAASVVFVMTETARVSREHYRTLGQILEEAGIPILDGVRCKGEGQLSDKQGDDIFTKALAQLIRFAKAVLGSIKPGHKYIKRERTPAGKWRYYYYNPNTEKIIVQEEGKTIEVRAASQGTADRRLAAQEGEEPKHAAGEAAGRRELPPVAREEDPEYCKLYWQEVRESGFAKMRFSDFVDPETEKQGDELLLKGKTSGYNVTMYEVGEPGGFASAVQSEDLSIIYSMYNVHPEHGKAAIRGIADTGAKFDYAVVKKASAVKWDESWGEDPGVQIEKHGEQLIGKSLEYCIVFRPDSEEDAEKIAGWLNDRCDANHEDALEDSWYVPDVRQTGPEKVDEYQDAVINMKKVGNQQLIVMTRETELEGFEHAKLFTSSSLREYFTKSMARRVKRPGLRGGKFYITKYGYVRYGHPPRGWTRERIAKLIQLNERQIRAKLRPLIGKYRLSVDEMDNLLGAFKEGALKSLGQHKRRGLDPWAHAVTRGYQAAQRLAQKQGPFKLYSPEQGFRHLTRVKNFIDKFKAEKGREPTEEETAPQIGIKPERVRELLGWDRLRRQGLQPETREFPSTRSPEEELEAREEEREREKVRERLYRKAEGLPAVQRAIILNRLREKPERKSDREMMQRLGINRKTFYEEQRNAEKRLRRLPGLREALKLYKSISTAEGDLLKAMFRQQRIVIRTFPTRSPISLRG